jgi:protein TonB
MDIARRIMNINEFLFKFRHQVSITTSCLVMLPLLHSWTPAFETPLAKTIPITLTLAKPEAQPFTTQQPSVRKPPQNTVKEAATAIQPPPIQPEANPPAPTQPSPITPQATTITQAAATTQNLHVATMPATPSAVIPDAKHNSEAWYASQIRAHLQSTKRYPTGREASLQRPSGTSVIWFIIRRNGELSDSGVETSSGSMLLDNAALSTVRRGAYPIFPEDIWPNKTQQRFTVELNFIPAS